MKNVIIAAIATVLAAGVTGCSGLEIGHKLWVNRVDERSEQSRTYRQNLPLACYFWKNCAAQQQQDESQGS